MHKALQKKHNFVYLIQEREFIKTRESVYKLGKTTQLPNSRLQGYPKQSRVLLYIEVSDCHSMEKLLITEFDKRYKGRRDIGREYYEGNPNHMKNTFFRVIGTEEEPDKIEEDPGRFWRAVYWTWNLLKR